MNPQYPHTPHPGVQPNCGLATASLVCGIAGFIVPLVFIPAIVCGHIAQGRIRKSGNALGGAGQALAGVILGYCAALLWVLVAGLAALGFVAGSSAINQRMMLTSKNAATSLETAVNQFYSEYGSLPDVGGDTVKTDRGEGARLLEILLGLEGDSGKMQNPNSFKFLNAKETNSRSKGGLLYNAGGRSVEGLYDAWGNPFVVELDTNYEERLRFTMGGKRVSLDARRVAVHSAGSDKKLGTDDDVKTW